MTRLNPLGLRTVIYPAPDLDRAKDWWTQLLASPPYFDQPFYVGYDVAGYELGLLPDANPGDGALTYWGVADVAGAMRLCLDTGATEHTPATEVGEGIITGSVRSPDGYIVGFIYNPHFRAATTHG